MNSRQNNRKGANLRQVIEYRHSYHCFLAAKLPHLLPPPPEHEWTLPPSPVSSVNLSSSSSSKNVDLRFMNLNASDAKKQDHYLLLGLQDKRHEATPADIKAAYRARVLEYHPDKMQQSSAQAGDHDAEAQDNIFKCIFFAYQILSDPEKRKLYDSVDSNAVDESIPAENAFPAGDVEAFLKIYRPVFLRNARFSRKQPVTDIGHAFSPREDVEAFYVFWSNFESWRTFDFLDEEESEHAENRADKRWLEKKNKAARQKRKNDDNARLRKLFEQAYKLDPRMVAFRADDKLRKEAKKMDKGMAALRISQEKERVKAEQERLAKEEKERIAIAQAESKITKDATSAKLKREKAAFKKIVIHENLYFVKDKLKIALINERSLLVEKFILNCKDMSVAVAELERRYAQGETEEIMTWIQEEYENKRSETPVAVVLQKVSEPLEPTLPVNQAWSLQETDMLINAVKNHPGGLRERWEKIAEWYNRSISHVNKSLPTRTAEEIIQKANEIKQTTEEGHGSDVVPSAAQADYKTLQKKRDPRIDQAEPTVVYDACIWPTDDQKKLEQGIKLFKSDDSERWDKIAEFVGKSKKDCMLRAKEIAQMLKQKKGDN